MSNNYRCLNFFDICRLCTACSDNKINIFSPEGIRKNLCAKISECLSLVVDEKDRLPTVLCLPCVQNIENIVEFRITCLNSQSMLSNCLNTVTQQSDGRLPVTAGCGKNFSVVGNGVTDNAMLSNVLPTSQIFISQNSIAPHNNNFLNSIVQAVGLQQTGNVQLENSQFAPQYTITLDKNGSVKADSVEYGFVENTVTAKNCTAMQYQQTREESKSK